MARRVRTRTAPVVGSLPASSARRRAGGTLELGARIPSRGGLPRDQVSEIQRSRLLVGAVGAIEEHGYAGMTVAHITRRARVSRRTFYELFEDREACLAALLGDVLALLEGELAQADLGGLGWRERVRGGLLVILGFFDREPALARVCVVQALRSGPRVLEQREAILTQLAKVIDQGRKEGERTGDCTPMTAEGLVGAALAILHTRVLRGERKPLTNLLGELMGMIVLPYLGPAAARAERTRTPARTLRGTPAPAPSPLGLVERDPLRTLPMRVTYRTARVLECVEREPGVSNRGVADAAGIKDQGQISKLLARLERLGLLENTGPGAHSKGEPNAWALTPLGQRVAQRLRTSIARESETT
jgi:AcrR family transcriptional regulator